MNTNNTADPVDDDSTGVLDDAIAIDTTAIGIVGSPATAQVTVVMPVSPDDDLADDEVIDGEVDEASAAELRTEPFAESVEATSTGRRLPAVALDPVPASSITISSVPPTPAAVDGHPEVDGAWDADDRSGAVDADADAEIPLSGESAVDSTEGQRHGSADDPEAEEAIEVEEAIDVGDEFEDEETADDEHLAPTGVEDAVEVDEDPIEDAVEVDEGTVEDAVEVEESPVEGDDTVEDEHAVADAVEDTFEHDHAAAAEDIIDEEPAQTLETVATAGVDTVTDASGSETAPAFDADGTTDIEAGAPADADAPDAEEAPVEAAPEVFQAPAVPAPAPDEQGTHGEQVEHGERAEDAPLPSPSPVPLPSPSPSRASSASDVAPPAITTPTRPVTRRAAFHPESKEVARVDETKRSVTRQAAKAAPVEQTPAAKRVGDLNDAARESADLLTSDRLVVPSRTAKPEPEGAWPHFVYSLSGGRINLGDGRQARRRKELSARIAAPLPGGARFVPVMSRKGGVGKTAVTVLLGMALADARDDRVIAIDANPDRGTLADRIVHGAHTRSVRDLAKARGRIDGYHDVSALVARDTTRLDVLASDDDPRVAEAFGDPDYRDVAEVAAHYYSLVLTDTGTGIVHDVMTATLDLADRLVIVSGLSVDEARLASETLTWLETNGFAQQARDAIVVLNHSSPGTPLVRVDELQAHFATRAGAVVRMPYDAQIAAGGPIVFANLQPATRLAARELAALVVEGLRAEASA